MSEVKFYPIAGVGVMIKFADTIDAKINSLIRCVILKVTELNLSGVIELVPSYADLVIHYNPSEISYTQICQKIDEIIKECANLAQGRVVNVVEIPVCYDNEFALDKDSVISHTKLDWDKIIYIHTSGEYLVYMMGFMPGFCYLGGMDERIATPRLKSPRQKIPAGSVGLAGSQTGVYPWQSPGGWQIIGQTPIKMYDENREKPSVVESGDFIKFKAINLDKFKQIQSEVLSGKFEVVATKEYRD